VRIPSVASRDFWRACRRLPPDVRKAVTRAYRIWQVDAFHPSLHFKKVGGDLWSVRVGIHHRALGTFLRDRIVWTWVGTHAEYDTLLG